MATTESSTSDQDTQNIEPPTMRAAVYLVFEKGDKILVSHRINSGYHDGEFGIPTGHIEDGEPASGAAIRKAKEEVGVALRMSELRLVHVMHRSSGSDKTKDYIDFYFSVLNFAGEPINKIPNQCDELKWVRWNALPPNTVPEVRYALERIKEDKVYSEFDFLAE